MPIQNKHGKYEVFDKSKASWVCPVCKRDSLKLNEFFDDDENPTRVVTSFVCTNCDFDSKDFAITMGPTSTYNSVYRWLMREWKWINYITNKFYMNGVGDAVKVFNLKDPGA